MKFLRIPLTVSLLLLFASCKKDTLKEPTSFTLYVVNAAVNSKITTNFTNNAEVAYNTRGQYFVHTGQAVYVAGTTLPTPLVNTAYNYDKGVYTLFLTGISPAFETIVKPETDLPFIPLDKNYTAVDSVVNVRFINLSPNSVPLKIKISTATTNEADALAYKEITNWRAFKATATSTTYSIQVRNPLTDALISTYSFVANASNRFKNVTLMIRGLQGTTSGVNAFGITPINYF